MPRLMIMTGYWSDHCQAGKGTLLNCLAAAIPGGERVLSGEEVFELQLPPGVGTCSKTHWAGGHPNVEAVTPATKPKRAVARHADI